MFFNILNPSITLNHSGRFMFGLLHNFGIIHPFDFVNRSERSHKRIVIKCDVSLILLNTIFKD